MIRKLLIANRGEIACRIIRTARRMGIATVAVYSDADAQALHVRMADETVRLGPPPAVESYLNVDAIIEAALAAKADAIHPGYGFLSENAGFVEACGAAGLIFVGPPADAIRAMGDKANAKALMRAAGVAVVPGYDGGDQSPERLAQEAERIGFPLLVKAAAGGGGRGMRRVDAVDDLLAALESARREAENAFGDGKLLLEKLVEDARHIEIQVFGDRHGTIIHLGERDCSTQRRHQKIIEEAPSPFVDESLRTAMGEAAVAAARAVGYVGAGTVEFIVGQDRRFFFLEMNTRLQVEHPVTEMISGLDLVEWQLRVARGEALPYSQEEVRLSGHAIEARLCAEDPANGFMPQTGKVLHWRPDTKGGNGIRVDHGLAEGDEVTPYYDPMIAKVIVHGETRADAVAKLERALVSAPLLGVVTNRAFLLDLLRGETFRSGGMTTGLVDQCGYQADEPDGTNVAIAAASMVGAAKGDWFSSAGLRRCPLTLLDKGTSVRCAVLFERNALVGVDVEGVFHPLGPNDLGNAVIARDGDALWIDRDGRVFRFGEPDPLARGIGKGDDRVVRTPVSGLLRNLSVTVGQQVKQGQVVAVIEAMKMETQLSAGRDGRIAEAGVRAGDQVRAGDIVLRIEDEVTSP
ncbi:acetyl-CoA carboxylase biotin carboxylase subunit [Mesorhizobium sp. CAU 1741]|uniref:acetyl/propionyl/methylcrotonyl-CoA carboxylase subunit alpha n=1 Tax=Mesorhizobium sp. CAU 1741 TaxID=3140366 RepID=UPI00325A9E85